ncbi:uncharacterized protein LOC129170911 [Dunckerocampus dactyliophorus]|uniref:uncharacterized protein LOC129170911 n=1 Tax=Dunckerocampus dactyliophorus TaxID=161453 RepID=UPI0024069432|nr:uncharacterized protein LOC129170911 [Dunckerocampus dactyliophorus]
MEISHFHTPHFLSNTSSFLLKWTAPSQTQHNLHNLQTHQNLHQKHSHLQTNQNIQHLQIHQNLQDLQTHPNLQYLQDLQTHQNLQYLQDLQTHQSLQHLQDLHNLQDLQSLQTHHKVDGLSLLLTSSFHLPTEQIGTRTKTRTMWMTSMALWLAVIILQFGGLTLTAVTAPACRPPGHVVLEAHRLLSDLGASFSVHCLPYNAHVSFPRAALANRTANGTQCGRALRTLYESLQGAEQVFEDNDIAEGQGGVRWDRQKLDTFQNLQNRLLVEGSCMSALGDSAGLSSYFRNVSALVHQQDSAPCGWLALRRDLLWLLKLLLQKHRNCFSW